MRSQAVQNIDYRYPALCARPRTTGHGVGQLTFTRLTSSFRYSYSVQRLREESVRLAN